MPELSILIPVLGRPHLIVPLLEDIAAATDCSYEVVLIGTKGDDAANQEIAKAIRGKQYPLRGCFLPPNKIGDYAIKINHGYRITDSENMFLGATDLHFHPGWYWAATGCLGVGIGVVGTQDMGNRRVKRGEHSTHSLVTRPYADEFGTIDEPGKILHEGYWHEYVDDELVQTAIARKAFKFANRSRVEHMHPWWGKAPSDAGYELIRNRCEYGEPIFNERRKLWTSTSLSPRSVT